MIDRIFEADSSLADVISMLGDCSVVSYISKSQSFSHTVILARMLHMRQPYSGIFSDQRFFGYERIPKNLIFDGAAY